MNLQAALTEHCVFTKTSELPRKVVQGYRGNKTGGSWGGCNQTHYCQAGNSYTIKNLKGKPKRLIG